MARKVKWISSDRAGAPTLSATKGSYVSLLDAVLVNGFNIKSVSAPVASSGVVTLPVGSGHGFVKDDVVLIAGATGSYAALNSEFDVVSVDSTSVSVAASVPDGSVSGTLTVKFAPLGWDKIFGDTLTGAYRSKDITSSQGCLRVDHTTYANAALIKCFKSMSSIDTGVDQFPTSAQMSSKFLFWPAMVTAPRWNIVGDGKTFYFTVSTLGNTYLSPTTSQYGMWAGDFEDWRPGGAYNFGVSGFFNNTINTSDATCTGFPQYSNFGASYDTEFIMRDYLGVTASAGANSVSVLSGTSGSYVGPSVTADSLASRVDGGVATFPVVLLEHLPSNGGKIVRGKYRGAYVPICGAQSTTDYVISPTVDDPAGRMLVIVCNQSCAMFDLKGAW